MNKELSPNIKQFQEGNKQAFKTIFDCLFRNICLFINRFINDLPAAEDICQETFISLWNHREEMQSSTHIKSFLYLSAHNAAIDYLRHEKIKNTYTERALQEFETTEMFVHFVIEEEVEQIMLKMQQELPTQCHRIFVLAMQGKSNEEIASTLNISVNTVKTQKKIAYSRLRKHIVTLSYIITWLLLKSNV